VCVCVSVCAVVCEALGEISGVFRFQRKTWVLERECVYERDRDRECVFI